MEKYRNTADHSTGIHPFIPIVGVGFPVLNVVLAPVFLAVRVPVFLVGACLLVLSEFIGPISSLAAKTLLVAFGASRVEEKLLRPGADDTPEIIVANHGSFIDVLHVASRFSARTFVIYDAGDRKFVSKSLLKAILHSFSSADVPSSTDNKVLEVDFKAIKYPALVLPEGTTSNGRGLLTFESGAFRGMWAHKDLLQYHQTMHCSCGFSGTSFFKLSLQRCRSRKENYFSWVQLWKSPSCYFLSGMRQPKSPQKLRLKGLVHCLRAWMLKKFVAGSSDLYRWKQRFLPAEDVSSQQMHCQHENFSADDTVIGPVR
mmetsp:Transcript_43512/g.170242  ORF Transcript_43512/g.170242 Transcript_43512/m.170242 type:complete len:315 (-) Transcript_43512:2353-3297(-)